MWRGALLGCRVTVCDTRELDVQGDSCRPALSLSPWWSVGGLALPSPASRAGKEVVGAAGCRAGPEVDLGGNRSSTASAQGAAPQDSGLPRACEVLRGDVPGTLRGLAS